MNVVVVARTQEEADRLAHDLMATGEVLVLDALCEIDSLPHVLQWRPDVLVVHKDLVEDVRALKPGRPLLVYDDHATVGEIVSVLRNPPEPPPPAPAVSPPRRGLIMVFQGAYGGAGTTTVVCALALAAAQTGLRVLILDTGEDCALTLGVPADVNGIQAVSGVAVISRVPGQPPLESLLSAYDLILVDAGTVRESHALVRYLGQFGASFYQVASASRQADLLSLPGYGLVLNNVLGGAPWWRQADAQIPFVPGLTARINAQRFAEPSPLIQAAGMFLEKVAR